MEHTIDNFELYNNTNDKCNEMCSDRGFKFFGIGFNVSDKILQNITFTKGKIKKHEDKI
mgnify:CR=1 FL=1